MTFEELYQKATPNTMRTGEKFCEYKKRIGPYRTFSDMFGEQLNEGTDITLGATKNNAAKKLVYELQAIVKQRQDADEITWEESHEINRALSSVFDELEKLRVL